MKRLIILFLLFSLSLSAQEQAEIPPVTNNPVLPELLKDFYQSARYWRIAHIKELQNVREIRFIKSDLNMLSDISEDGTIIYLNEALIEYEHLTRIILFRKIGTLYGIPELKRTHEIMNTHWQIDARHEMYSEHLSRQEWHDRHFFEALAKKAPIKVRL